MGNVLNMRKNIILADCCPEEVKSFANGCNEVSDTPFEIVSKISNWGYDSFIKNLWRFILYFSFPFKVFLCRESYNIIIGWQQFYAINFAFFCKLFHVKKKNIVVVANFTYKRKKSFLGWLYHKYMKFSCNNRYIDYLHVLSFKYVPICCEELGLDENKFIVTGFGIPDTYEEMKGLKAPLDNYSLSIGRSNRDFYFLVNVWKQDCLKDKTLVIASDTWKPDIDIPKNVIHHNDIKYDDSFAWFNSCDLCITSIADGNICSGDTVLLTGMMFAKPVIVTSPSTLAEMYVKDEENGLCIPKDPVIAANKIAELLSNKRKMLELGKSARDSFLANFSRESMGKAIGSKISHNKNG